MSATTETKTTLTFDGTKENYRMFSSQILGVFMIKGIHRTLGPNFKDELLASENVSGQTTRQKNTMKDSTTAMSQCGNTVSATTGQDQRNCVRGLALQSCGSSHGSVGQEVFTKGPIGQG